MPPTITTTDRPLEKLSGDAVVIGVGKGPSGLLPTPGSEAVDRLLGGKLLAALADLGARGAEEEATRLPTFGQGPFPVVVAVGLGAPSPDGGYSPDVVRRAAGAASRALSGRRSGVTLLAAVGGTPDVERLHAVGGRRTQPHGQDHGERALAEGGQPGDLLLGAPGAEVGQRREQLAAEQPVDRLAARGGQQPARALPDADDVSVTGNTNEEPSPKDWFSCRETSSEGLPRTVSVLPRNAFSSRIAKGAAAIIAATHSATTSFGRWIAKRMRPRIGQSLKPRVAGEPA